MISNTWSVVHQCGYQPGDRLILFLPLFHVFGQNFVANAGLPWAGFDSWLSAGVEFVDAEAGVGGHNH